MGLKRISSMGTASLLIVIGALLLVFPEPATSGIGLLMIIAGLVMLLL